MFNPQTGEQILYEKLERSQFPVMSDILNEIAVILECYPVESMFYAPIVCPIIKEIRSSKSLPCPLGHSLTLNRN